MKDAFDEDGYVRIDGALPPGPLEALRRRMDAAAEGTHGATVKLGDDAEAASLIATASLRAAFDALLGPGGWIEPETLEDLRIKRPAPPDAAPWWHIDVFERGPRTIDDDVTTWRASPRCGDVGLLVLLLLSDVGPADAATAVRVGSHRAVARRLGAMGDDGLSLGELLDLGIDAETADAPVVLTTGAAGTAFLCDPMLVHSARSNSGTSPSYWALPAIRRAGTWS